MQSAVGWRAMAGGRAATPGVRGKSGVTATPGAHGRFGVTATPGAHGRFGVKQPRRSHSRFGVTATPGAHSRSVPTMSQGTASAPRGACSGWGHLPQGRSPSHPPARQYRRRMKSPPVPHQRALPRMPRGHGRRGRRTVAGGSPAPDVSSFWWPGWHPR